MKAYDKFWYQLEPNGEWLEGLYDEDTFLDSDGNDLMVQDFYSWCTDEGAKGNPRAGDQ